MTAEKKPMAVPTVANVATEEENGARAAAMEETPPLPAAE